MDTQKSGPRPNMKAASQLIRRISTRFRRSPARSPSPAGHDTGDSSVKDHKTADRTPAAHYLDPIEPHYSGTGLLLALPREIRDQILAYVLQQHQNDPPALKQTLTELTRDRKIPNKPQLASWTKVVLHSPETILANATGLLRANHQLRSEVLENIERLNARVYELDVIILDETLPILTWLHVPLFTNHVDQVNVTFRISGTYNEARMNHWQPQSDDKHVKRYATYDRYKGFRGHGDGHLSCYPIAMQLYSILERFIKAGPVGDLSEDHEHRHVVVKAININVETPPGINPALFSTPLSSVGSPVRAGSVLNPTFLARLIANYIAMLLNGPKFDAFWLGQLMFEHVDVFTVSRDGRKVRTIDVAQRLEALKYFSYKEERFSAEQLEQYKAATWKIRKERGLECLKH